jgi:predicted NBD/HSP70 family sugar kinase
VGIAGVVDHAASELLRAPNLGSVDGIDILATFTDSFDVPVVVDNDVNLAALGEQRYGLGQDISDFVVIAIGTGIGMGIVANGRLLRGATGAAGEIGYLPIGADPLEEENQRRGPLEEILAGASIASRYNTRAGTNVGTRDVFALAADGDEVARHSVELEAEFVARAIVAVSAVLDPALVILSGGIGTRPGFAEMIPPWLAALGAPHLRVRASDLANAGSALGAIELARQSTTDFRLDPQPAHQETPALDHHEGTP